MFSYFHYLWDPRFFHEETRILANYHRFADASLFPGDYVTGYLDSNAGIWFFQQLNRVWAAVFGDLTFLHRTVLPLVTALAFVVGLALATYRLGGPLVAATALTFALLEGNILYRLGSTIAHSFAFPLLAWTLCALLYRNLWGLIAATLLTAAFYPPIVPLPGLTLAWFLLVTKKESRGRAESLSRFHRLGLLALVGVGALLLAYPSLPTGNSAYGDFIAPGTQVDQYPENGPGGRHFRGTLQPISYAFLSFFKQFSPFTEGDLKQNFGAIPLPVLIASGLLVALFCGFLFRKTERDSENLLKGFVGSALVVGVLFSVILQPYGYRFIFYSLHLMSAVLFALALWHGLRRFLPRHRQQVLAASGALTLMLLLTQGGKPGVMTQAVLYLTDDQWANVDYIAAQPKDILVAGWPGITIEAVPYFAKRSALVTYKTSYPSHHLYIQETRRRMVALIACYTAVSQEPCQELHQDFGVDFLIVERLLYDNAHRQPPGPPPLFSPYDAQIEAVWQDHAKQGFYLAAPPKRAIAFDTETVYVLDLAKF
ncbi:MAG: hypothetical protein ACPGO3_06860 [Magnetospiraceae bacterium]